MPRQAHLNVCVFTMLSVKVFQLLQFQRNVLIRYQLICHRKLTDSCLPNPRANNCSVAIVGLQVPLSIRLILDWRIPERSASSFCVIFRDIPARNKANGFYIITYLENEIPLYAIGKSRCSCYNILVSLIWHRRFMKSSYFINADISCKTDTSGKADIS